MKIMPQDVGKRLVRRFGAVSAALAVLGFLVWPLGAPRAEEVASPPARDSARLAQLPRYTASGTHQCGEGKARCIVSGQFNDCNDAATSLRTRDCCATARKGASSTGFTMNYCIPESIRR
jgi:hypothetical protein